MPNGSCRNSSRMLKKAASGVLASLRGSTYRSVRLASSLAAALLNSLFEHPESTGTSTPFSEILTIVLRDPSFSAACLAGKKPVSFSQTRILHYSGLSITYDDAPASSS
jgi:hypothetical protein